MSENQELNRTTGEVMALPEQPPPSPVSLSSETFATMLEEETRKRSLLKGFISAHLVAGTDFGTIEFGNGRSSKPSLFKPGAEKVCSLLNLKAQFARDAEFYEMLGEAAKGWIAFTCQLFTVHGAIAAEGRGAAGPKHQDLNTRLKMAQKSAQIDATLRVAALSDYFTQDLEDMTPDPPRGNPPAVSGEAPAAPATIPGTTIPLSPAPQGRPATEKQQGMIFGLAKDRQLIKADVEAYCREHFGMELDALTTKWASQLIDDLKQGLVPRRAAQTYEPESQVTEPLPTAEKPPSAKEVDEMILEVRKSSREYTDTRLHEMAKLLCKVGLKPHSEVAKSIAWAERQEKLPKDSWTKPMEAPQWAALEARLASAIRATAQKRREAFEAPVPF